MSALGACAAALTVGRTAAYAETSLRTRFSPDVGRKFDAHGRVLPYQGNTVLCHLDQQGPNARLFNALLDIYREAPSLSFAHKMALLPPSSYHMTVFVSAHDKERGIGHWPNDVPSDLPIDACNLILADRLKFFRTACALPLRMRVDLSEPTVNIRPLTLRLVPNDETENTKLRGLRDRLSETLSIRTAKHGTYPFHVTLAYTIQELSDRENEDFRAAHRRWHERVAAACPVIELGAPEYCVLDDMFAFHRQFYLEA